MTMPADQAAKERPILMSAPMVRAILAGTKTQTRRVVKQHKAFGEWGVNGPDDAYDATTDDDGQGFFLVAGDHGYAGPVPCPYGQPGDRLWVRETWSPDFANYYPHDRAFYAADKHHQVDIEVRDGVRGIYSPESRVFVPFKWRPSIHMPRLASRITLEIVSVRVERLQDISEADAKYEGIAPLPHHDGRWMSEHAKGLNFPSAVAAFRTLWESINGPGSWAANPWVWVVEFRRLP